MPYLVVNPEDRQLGSYVLVFVFNPFSARAFSSNFGKRPLAKIGKK